MEHKVILITGATDGIGLQLARQIAAKGYCLILHGRNQQKLDKIKNELKLLSNYSIIETIKADLSYFDEVYNLVTEIKQRHSKIDVIINNAGVYKSSINITKDDLDIRFMVNTIAPYIINKQLINIMPKGGRIINVASAAQAPVDLDAFKGKETLEDGLAYAQSKLGLIMWSSYFGKYSNINIFAVNPGSLLATNMVRDAYGLSGYDISIGSTLLEECALGDKFEHASGKYYDNDKEDFTNAHRHAYDDFKCLDLIKTIEDIIQEKRP